MMTKQQINWASEHDWFLAVSKDGQGVEVRDDMEQDKWIEIRDFKQLKSWAGY